ncbi:hypothetical protein AB4P95_11705 [Pseudomonas sp. A1437]|uniref:hypothetical protein n=1 Tax=unclassified Pseudomonas TaxID=196821 RepID=UPI003784A30A
MNEQMREEFEAWVLSEYPNQRMSKFADGEYHSTTIQHCWLSWQAARATREIPACDAALDPVALALMQDLASHKRMLLAAVCDLGAIGEALKSDMDADGDELLGMVIDLKAQNTRMLGWLQDISRTSGDKGAVMGARQLLKEFGQ